MQTKLFPTSLGFLLSFPEVTWCALLYLVERVEADGRLYNAASALNCLSPGDATQ